MITKHEPAKPAAKPAPHQIDPLKPSAPSAEERVRAYHRLAQLDAAPSITFSQEEEALLAQYSKESTAEQSRQAEIIKNRKILGLSPQ